MERIQNELGSLTMLEMKKRDMKVNTFIYFLRTKKLLFMVVL